MAEVERKVEHYALLTLSRAELRLLVNRLSPEDSFLYKATLRFLPDDHEEMAEEMAEKLRRFHDRNPWPE